MKKIGKIEKLKDFNKTLKNIINNLEIKLFVENTNIKNHIVKTTTTTKRN